MVISVTVNLNHTAVSVSMLLCITCWLMVCIRPTAVSFVTVDISACWVRRLSSQLNWLPPRQLSSHWLCLLVFRTSRCQSWLARLLMLTALRTSKQFVRRRWKLMKLLYQGHSLRIATPMRYHLSRDNLKHFCLPNPSHQFNFSPCNLCTVS